MGQLHVTLQKSNGKLLFVKKTVKTIILFAIGITLILPFVWMLSTSFKPEAEVFAYPMQWIPSTFNLNNYREVWFGNNSFFIFYWNSIRVTLITIFGQVIISSLAAYAFARINFTGKNVVFLLYISMMMIPPQVTIIPKFLIFDKMGLIDTHASIILPTMCSVFGIFMLRQFFISIPKELSEAAYIDGASEFKIWWRVVMPLARPAITSLIILSFVWSWNNYQTPLILLRSKDLYTIPLGLDFFMDDMGMRYALIMTAAVASIVPMLIVYIVGQKQFIESVALSGIKG